MPDGAISFPLLGDFYINPSRYFQIGSLKVYWYGVIIAVAFIICIIYATKRSHEFGIAPDNLLDAVIIGLPVSVIFGRLYYVVFNWSLYKDNLSEIYKIWHGGIAIYGVLIGALVTVIIYTRVKKISLLSFLDIVGISFMIGQFIGRWGNFINREAYGYETTLPWRMGLTNGGVTTYVHPTFLYESLWNIIGFIFIHYISKKHRKFDGQIFAMYIGWYGLGRVWIEGLRTDSLYFLNTGIRVSQVVAGVTFLVAVIYLAVMIFKIKPGPEKMYVNKVRLAEEAAENNGNYGSAQSDNLNNTTKDKSKNDSSDLSGPYDNDKN